jgi:acetylornithine/N-succinyldiaminopimelate aminotransferase
MAQEHDWQVRDFQQWMIPCYAPMSVLPVKGKGSRVWDNNGKEYVDFAGGIAVSALGHCHPVMVNALIEQAQTLWHVSNVMTNVPALTLAETLVSNTFADKVFFANSGAEANEAALKLARRYAHDRVSEEKNEIIAFTQGFHGRTFFTVSVGGQPQYSSGFGPNIQGITHLPYGDLACLKKAFSARTCAVILEPLQGEGGVIVPSLDFLAGVRQLCDEFDALMIFDEVQTGNGRTGSLFAYQDVDVIPDILTTAKSLGGGMPIAAMLTTENIASYFSVGVHGSTYGGNPLACAVASAVWSVIADPDVLAGVKVREQWLRDGLAQIQRDRSIFTEIRGKGLLLGAELNAPWQGKAKFIMEAAAEEGVLILMAGSNVLRFTPSLLIDKDSITLGMQALQRAIEKVCV